MKTAKKTIKITVIVNRQLTQSVIDTLNGIGIHSLYIESGRTSIIEEKDGMFSFLSGKRLGNDPVDIITFFIAAKYESQVLDFIADRFDFKTPGRGTVFSNEIGWVKGHPLCIENAAVGIPKGAKAWLFKELKGICCIVQRGEGDRIARKCLEMGASVPVTTYGTGTGVRDKLGLLRITIPAEKELINLVMSEYDIDSIMELMIVEGRLDEPGKGFAYMYPVKQGIIDTKISRGKTGQVASIEQVVSAIDAIKGGMEWRKSRFESEKTKKRFYLKNLTELVLVCNEGHSLELMQAAMANGAAGATISMLKYRSKVEETKDRIPPTREICKMVVGEAQVPAIARAIEAAGGFGDAMHGLLYTLAAPKAFTFIPKK